MSKNTIYRIIKRRSCRQSFIICFFLFILSCSSYQTQNKGESSYVPPVIEWGETDKIVTDREDKLADQYYKRAYLFFNNKDYQNAIFYIQKSILIDPEDYRYYALMGYIFEYLNYFFEAEKYYEKAYYLNKLNADILRSLISVYIINEKKEFALEAAEHYGFLKGSKYFAEYLRGIINSELGDYEKALDHFDNAIKYNIYLDPHFKKAELLTKMQKYNESIKIYNRLEKVIENKPITNAVTIYKGVSTNNSLRLIILSDISEKRHYNNFLKEIEAGKKALEQNKKNKLLDSIINAQKLNATSDQVLYLKAAYEYHYQQNTNESIKILERSIILNKSNIDSYILYSQIAVNNKEYLKAYSLLQDASKYDPYNKRLLEQYLNILAHNHSPLTRKKFTGELYRLYNTKESIYNLADVYYKEGDYIRSYQVLKDNFDSPFYNKIEKYGYLQRAYYLLKQNKSLAAYKIFTSITDSKKDDLVVNGRLESLMEDGNYEKAVLLFEDYVQVVEDPAIYNWQFFVKLHRRVMLKSRFADYYSEQRELYESLLTRLENILLSKKLTFETLDYKLKIEVGDYPEFSTMPFKHKEDVVVKKILHLKLTMDDQDKILHYIETLVNISSNTNYVIWLGDAYIKKIEKHINDKNFKDANQAIARVQNIIKDYNLAPFYSFDFDYFYQQIEIKREMEVAENLLLKKENLKETIDYFKYLTDKFYYLADSHKMVLDYYFENRMWHNMYLGAQTAIQVFPKESIFYYYISHYYTYIANYKKAAFYIKKAIKYNKFSSEYYIQYAKIMKNIGNAVESEYLLNLALENTSDYLTIYRELGNLYYHFNMDEKALIYFNNALSLDPSDINTLHNLGLFFLNQGQYKQAYRYFNKVTFYAPHILQSRYLKAKTLYQLERYDEAKSILESLLIIRVDPYYYYSLGRIYEKKMLQEIEVNYNKYRNLAIFQYNKVLQISETSKDVYHWSKSRIKELTKFYYIKNIKPCNNTMDTAAKFVKAKIHLICVPANIPRFEVFSVPEFDLYAEFDLDSPIVSKIGSFGQFCSFSTERGILYIIDLNKKKIIYRYRMPVSINIEPVFLSEEIVILPMKNGNIIINNEGRIISEIKIGSPITTEILVKQDMIYFGTEDGFLQAFDAYSGKAEWELFLGAAPTGKMLFKNGIIYTGSLDNRFYAVNSKLGKVIYYYKNHNPPTTFSVEYDDKIFYGTESGLIRVIDSKGVFYWEYQGNGNSYFDPVFIPGRILISMDDGTIVCLDAGSGKEKFIIKLDSAPNSKPLILKNNLLFISTENGFLY